MLKHARKRWVHAALGIGIAAVFLWLSIRGIKPEALLAEIRSVDLRYLPLILLCLALFFWLKAIRWAILLVPLRSEDRLNWRQVVPAMMIGFMGNNVLPAHLGEFVRMFVLGSQYRLSKTSVLSTIVLERLFDFLVIVAIFAVSVQFLPLSEELELVRTGGYLIGGGCVVALLVCLAFVWRTGPALSFTERVLAVVPQRLRRRVLELVRLGVQGLASLRSGRNLAYLLVLSFVHWGLNGLCIHFSTLSFLGETSTGESRLPLLAPFFLLSLCALGVTLPSAPGYVGTLQFCFVIGLQAFQVPAETALAASFYYLAINYISVTLAGFFFLAHLGLRLSAVRREAETAAEAPSEERQDESGAS